jgi:hypothetical protein
MSATGRSPARVAQDVYPIPSYCIDKLLPYIDFSRQGCEGPPVTFLEPCRGDGAISDLIPKHVSKGYCEIREGTDYLRTPVFTWTDIIITNPPYSLALEFLRKSLSEAHTVVYLLRLNFLGSATRRPFWDTQPPTHLLTITPRPRLVNGGSDSCEYGWFCWDRGGRALTDRKFITL